VICVAGRSNQPRPAVSLRRLRASFASVRASRGGAATCSAKGDCLRAGYGAHMMVIMTVWKPPLSMLADSPSLATMCTLIKAGWHILSSDEKVPQPHRAAREHVFKAHHFCQTPLPPTRLSRCIIELQRCWQPRLRLPAKGRLICASSKPSSSREPVQRHKAAQLTVSRRARMLSVATRTCPNWLRTVTRCAGTVVKMAKPRRK